MAGTGRTGFVETGTDGLSSPLSIDPNSHPFPTYPLPSLLCRQPWPDLRLPRLAGRKKGHTLPSCLPTACPTHAPPHLGQDTCLAHAALVLLTPAGSAFACRPGPLLVHTHLPFYACSCAHFIMAGFIQDSIQIPFRFIQTWGIPFQDRQDIWPGGLVTWPFGHGQDGQELSFSHYHHHTPFLPGAWRTWAGGLSLSLSAVRLCPHLPPPYSLSLNISSNHPDTHQPLTASLPHLPHPYTLPMPLHKGEGGWRMGGWIPACGLPRGGRRNGPWGRGRNLNPSPFPSK